METAPSKVIQKSKELTEPLKQSTIKQYENTLEKIKSFNKNKEQRTKFMDLDSDFHDEFIDYLRNQENLSYSTIGNRIKNIKSISKLAKRKGIEVNEYVFTDEFFKPKEDGTYPYLDEKEIHMVFDYDFSSDKKLENVRDLFIIGLHTGLRISDFTRIKSTNIKDGFIEIKTQKTGDEVVIPIHDQIEFILNKYDGCLPRSISHQKFNEYVKIVCQKVGLDEIIKGTKRGNPKMGIRTRTGKFPKFELISSHCCRRSFATNHFGELPTVVIMAITGHKTEKAFLKYIKKTPKDHAKVMKEYWLKTRKEHTERLTMKVV